jgi:hypothetical protein
MEIKNMDAGNQIFRSIRAAKLQLSYWWQRAAVAGR